MTTRRQEVIAAFETGDELAVKQLGWWPVWEAAATWWGKHQRVTAREFVPYAKLLGDEDPDKVLEAFRELATGEWRPSAAVVRGHLYAPDESQVDVGRGRDRAAEPEALFAVADAYRAGERPCTCGFHHPMWTPDAAAVLRCRRCGGLQQGQLYDAEDAGLLSEAPAMLPPALTEGVA